MPTRVHGGVFNQQVITGSQRYFVIEGADFSGSFKDGQPVPFSAAEIIFNLISQRGYINIMNPYDIGISFALEINRSAWDAESLTEAIQGLGDDVGVDHIDCSDCIVIEVPFNFQYLSGSGGSSSFIGLDDVTTPSLPNGYVLWDPTGTKLIYSTTIPYSVLTGVPPTVNKIIAGLNISISPADGVGDVTISASGTLSGTIVVEDEGIVLGAANTLNFTGVGVTSTFDGSTATIDISSGGGSGSTEYIPVPPDTGLELDKRYFVTAAGSVFLPNFTGATIGASVVVTKSCPNTNIVFINSVNGPTSISTDIGSTDSIELDSTVESIFIFNGSTWNLQIGSIQ